MAAQSRGPSIWQLAQGRLGHEITALDIEMRNTRQSTLRNLVTRPDEMIPRAQFELCGPSDAGNERADIKCISRERPHFEGHWEMLFLAHLVDGDRPGRDWRRMAVLNHSTRVSPSRGAGSVAKRGDGQALASCVTDRLGSPFLP